MINAWVLVLLAFVVLYIFSQRRPKHFPPGPWGFPVLGHLPLLGVEPYKVASAWKSKYGPVVGVDFASFPTVIISDHKLAKEAMAHPGITSRPKVAILSARSLGHPEGIAFSGGSTWREQRTFAHRYLRQTSFGAASVSVEEIIVREEQKLVETLAANHGHPISTHTLFNISFFNIMWTLMFGAPLEDDHPTTTIFIAQVIDAFSKVDIFSALSMFMPWFANNFPLWLTRADHIDSFFKKGRGIIQPFVDEHLETADEGGVPRGYVDAFMNEMRKTEDVSSSFHKSRYPYSLLTSMMDLFMGGTETGAKTLQWICLLLATNPGVQKRVAQEVVQTVGPSKNSRLGFPTRADRKLMPFTEAVLYETMRFRTLAPLGAFHSTTEDVQFHGHLIPKDTMVQINIYDAHNDMEIWGDPGCFRPERWLSPDGLEFVGRERLLSFSSGKRICIGEHLVRDELFHFTTGICQAFKIELNPAEPHPTIAPQVGGTTVGPHPHTLRFIPREPYSPCA